MRLRGDEERSYWRIRIILEFARAAAVAAWDVLRHCGAGPF
jgi:hypothetical protein